MPTGNYCSRVKMCSDSNAEFEHRNYESRRRQTRNY